MTVRDAIHIFKISQKNIHRKRTTDSYRYLLEHLEDHFTDIHVEAIAPEHIYQFLEALTEHAAKSTRRLRYAQLKAFFNFLINEKRHPMKNPCQDSIMVKAFKSPRMKQRDILSRESVDEIIYRSKKIRDRLILELQARCGMRIGEVLNLRASDITDRKLVIRQPKSGKDMEVAFMTESIAKRLSEYVRSCQHDPEGRIFPICYSSALSMVRKLGKKIGIHIRPHDLRRYSATYASRNGIPLEVVSKVLLRHQDLKTTQMYLGKITDTEAIRWMDVLHGN
ncbi:MAG: tyrosine-type recombinase/integrase [Proteobacteria bacterium]|nr:tyrosine-type recombinase/integrase [Pseudomonadota bacterium]